MINFQQRKVQNICPFSGLEEATTFPQAPKPPSPQNQTERKTSKQVVSGSAHRNALWDFVQSCDQLKVSGHIALLVLSLSALI